MLGAVLTPEDAGKLAASMVDHLFEAMKGGAMRSETAGLHRLPALPAGPPPDIVTISGGVSEFLYADTNAGFSDLGPLLARQLRKRLDDWRPRLERPEQGIRATVVGASQYTVQVSGSTIFVRPLDALPVRNVPVIKPAFAFDDDIDAERVGLMVKEALARLDLTHGDSPVAICYEWQGSASYRRLDDFCRGIREGLSQILAKGHPLILVGDSDVGGLVGMHFVSADGVNSIISIDGIKLDEFDFIDIGAMLETSGAVPVVIKSLVFPNMGLGQKGLEPVEPA